MGSITMRVEDVATTAAEVSRSMVEEANGKETVVTAATLGEVEAALTVKLDPNAKAYQSLPSCEYWMSALSVEAVEEPVNCSRSATESTACVIPAEAWLVPSRV